MLLLTLSDTAATSQDGSSLEFVAAVAGRRCYIHDASGRALFLQGEKVLKSRKKMGQIWDRFPGPSPRNWRTMIY